MEPRSGDTSATIGPSSSGHVMPVSVPVLLVPLRAAPYGAAGFECETPTIPALASGDEMPRPLSVVALASAGSPPIVMTCMPLVERECPCRP